jgi:PTH1 family peptidyl-tRNA hydrolase
MIRLIVGLGNPGRQYEMTRHNAGFLFLDKLLAEVNGAWSIESRFQGCLAEYNVGSQKVILLKPQTYMNLSGQSVGKVARYYKVLPEEMLVAHDELDLAVGVVRLKLDGGHAGHNGLRDIIAHLDSRAFYRLRIGIGRPSAGKPVADYVLSTPSTSESLLLSDSIDKAFGYVGQIISGDKAVVMNNLNA